MFWGGREWSDGQKPAGVSFSPSLSGSVFSCSDWSSGICYNMQVPTSVTRQALALTADNSPAKTFNKARGVISGCVKMSEHICWGKNVQTQCVSMITNQQLLILGKQSSTQPGLICLTPVDRSHQSRLVTVYSICTFFKKCFTCWIFRKVARKTCKLCL